MEDDFEIEHTYYADILCKIDQDEDSSVSYSLPDADGERTVTWTIEGDNITLDLEYNPTPGDTDEPQYPSEILGMCSSDGFWVTMGDCVQTYTKVDYRLTELPEDIGFEDWVLINEGAGHSVKIGFIDNDVYVTGLFPALNDAVVKGKIEGDKIVFDSKQFMGTALNHFIFFMGGLCDDDSISLADDISFAYDVEKKVMIAEKGAAIIINAGMDTVYYAAKYVNPKFKAQDSNANPIPSNPIPVSFSDYYEYYGCGRFEFILPNLNVEDNLIDTSLMYYEVFVDGDLYTFEPDIYDICEPITEVPYDFSDHYGIFSNNVYHYIDFYIYKLETIGVKLYNVVDGNVYCSNRVTWNIATNTYVVDDNVNVMQIREDKTVKEVEFYNLSGIKIKNPSGGVFVCKKTFEDGTSIISKVVIR